MKHGPKLELRHGQSLVMTQQLQQSIKLLQCTALELQQFVEAELEKNPFLTQEEPDSDGTPKEESAEPREDGEDDEENQDESSYAEASEDRPRETDLDMDNNAVSPDMESGADWDDSGHIETDYLRGDHSLTIRASSYDNDEEGLGIEDNPSQELTLREHLIEQMHMDVTDPVKRIVAAHLIDLVDEAGYIKDDMNAVAQTLGIETGEVEEVLGQLQTFDPPGICARNLSECLALQLKDKNRLDPAMQCMLDNLTLLGDGKFDQLQKRCGVDADDLRQMIAEIRELNPKPGSGFSHEITQTVEPDMFVRRTADANWHIELNMGNFPKVMVNKRYYKKITGETKNVKDKQYLTEQFGSANWLIRALEQRAQTMLKVGGELVKQQDAFFRLGVRYLKPMTLKTIAHETGYHESTISRVTNGKFLLCPRGTFELKYFFTSALSRTVGGGDDVSSNAVKDYIVEMVSKETTDHILSDDEIVEKLKERNITIARRTVAKYREAEGIPSSPKRKRLKTQGL